PACASSRRHPPRCGPSPGPATPDTAPSFSPTLAEVTVFDNYRRFRSLRAHEGALARPSVAVGGFGGAQVEHGADLLPRGAPLPGRLDRLVQVPLPAVAACPPVLRRLAEPVADGCRQSSRARKVVRSHAVYIVSAAVSVTREKW